MCKHASCSLETLWRLNCSGIPEGIERGLPQVTISDNGKTFVATGKWLKVLKNDASLFNFIGELNIKWRFDLSHAPWWGGFFERLIRIMKRSLSNSIGRILLKFAEIEEALIDVEASMNNRPLLYQGAEFEQPVITPNILLRGRPLPIDRGRRLEADWR